MGKSEEARTIGQLRFFAQAAEEGPWVQARIDPAQPDRKPLPRADIRSMLRPLGPVAVFGASNYQDFPGGALPEELRDGNPLGIRRLVDGVFTRSAVNAAAKAGRG